MVLSIIFCWIISQNLSRRSHFNFYYWKADLHRTTCRDDINLSPRTNKEFQNLPNRLTESLKAYGKLTSSIKKQSYYEWERKAKIYINMKKR